LLAAYTVAAIKSPKHTINIDLRMNADLHDQSCGRGRMFTPKPL
jgi:hypothetical protein